jgi:hypothetical protein
MRRTNLAFVLLLMVGVALLGVVTPVVAGQKGSGAPKSDGKFQLMTTSIAPNMGVSWADGRFSYKNQDYKFRVEAHTMTESDVMNYLAGQQITYEGLIYNLKDPSDFAGTYTRVKPEVVQAMGVTNTAVFQNEKGVVLRVTGSQKATPALQLRLLGDGFKVGMRDF